MLMRIRNLFVGLAFALGAMFTLSMPAHASKAVVVIGDSIMSQNVPQGVAKQHALAIVTQERDVTFKNLSSPGTSLGNNDKTGFLPATTVSTLNQLGGYYGAVDSIIIQAGTNDFTRNVPWADSYNSTVQILNWAQANGKKVLVLDMIWRAGEDTPNALGNTLNTYRYFQLVACNAYPTTCYFGHRENSILGTSAGAANYDATEVATGTQVHPNVAGHRILATWLELEAAAFGLF
jgi:hypothetical protein